MDLLEAAYAGNAKALPLLRGYYDWFNEQSFLPEMLRGAIQGGQGMIANTRVAVSPVGKPADAQVIQRYYQENAWLDGLAKKDPSQIWEYPYDRPHCYLLTDIEAYLDLYLVTGEKRYFDAAHGAWEMYRAHWQQAGGSISIIEFETDPPDSNYLKQKLGELCGSSFWVFLSQRFQLLDPENEQYATEIEKSIYNVALANQDAGNGFRYHTILEGEKEKSTHENTCCEGQGTRLIGSLPEHIFSLAPDGIYWHLYEASTLKWQQYGQEMSLAIRTQFPFDTFVEGIIHTPAAIQAKLRIRVPSWAISEMGISVNGSVAGSGKAGTYVTLDRQWAEGDKITFALPAAMRVRRYNGADQIAGKVRYAIEYGPDPDGRCRKRTRGPGARKGSRPGIAGPSSRFRRRSSSPLHAARKLRAETAALFPNRRRVVHVLPRDLGAGLSESARVACAIPADPMRNRQHPAAIYCITTTGVCEE